MANHSVVSYTEGEIALESLKREVFDLILMDVELAGVINGLEVVRQLRSHGLKTPIVAVTAYAMMGDRDKCLAAGCNDYLPKPLPISDFIALLARYEAILKTQGDAPQGDTNAAPRRGTGPLTTRSAAPSSKQFPTPTAAAAPPAAPTAEVATPPSATPPPTGSELPAAPVTAMPAAAVPTPTTPTIAGENSAASGTPAPAASVPTPLTPPSEVTPPVAASPTPEPVAAPAPPPVASVSPVVATATDAPKSEKIEVKAPESPASPG